MISILQVFYSVFSGALLATAIPNEIYLLGCPIFSFVALIPYYLAITKAKNYKQAFFLGFLQSITTHFISSFWLAYFKEFALFTLGASAFGTGLIGGLFALCLYIPFSTSNHQNKLNAKSLKLKWIELSSFKIIYFAAIYTLYEWGKSSGFLGYPWGTISSSMFKFPILTQIADITGTYGITFIVALFNCILAELYIYFSDNKTTKTNRFNSILFAAHLFSVLFVLSMVYGLYQYNKTRKPEKYLNTILVQQNSNPWNNSSDKETILLSEELTKNEIDKLAENNEKPQLVVWSEGCLASSFPNAEIHYKFYPSKNPLAKFVNSCNVPFIFGGSFVRSRAEKKVFNASILYDSSGNYRGIYGKNHLVPFAEAIPFAENPKIKNFLEKIIGISAGWTPGDQYILFEVPCSSTENLKLPSVDVISLNETYEQQKKRIESSETVKISTPICYDDAFTDIMRPLFLNGTELFVNITDDSWSLKQSSEYQHFVIASYRAIEYRTTLVRSANSGYSVVLSPTGKILKDMPLFEATSTNYNIPIYSRQITTYARFGNWFPYTIILLLFATGIYAGYSFTSTDYIPSERKLKKKSKKHSKKNSKNKK